MGSTICLVSALLLAIFCPVQSQNRVCNPVSLQPYQTLNVVSPGYPSYTYTPGSSCTYSISAPPNYQINAQCTISIPSNNGICSSEYFVVAPEGNPNPNYFNRYCSNGQVSINSTNNNMIIGYESKYLSGYFTCQVQAVPQTCDCGRSVNSKIVGGVNARANEFPSMVGISYYPESKRLCGGTIVSPRWVMSAAHCFMLYRDAPANSYRIIAGQLDARDEPSSYNTVRHYVVQSIVKHPYYAPGTNDIALVMTSQYIVYNLATQATCLPFFYPTVSFNSSVIVTGWGSVEYGGPNSNILQKVALNVWRNDDCRSTFKLNVQPSQMCTFTPKKDSCSFDSGGPLYFSSYRQHQVGITSSGSACATNQAAINTRVTDYMGWIESVVGTLCHKTI